MVRYLYNKQSQPPAPYVYVTLRNLEDSLRVERVPALLDCGADRTVIPGKLAEAIGLRVVDEARFGLLDGTSVNWVTSHVGITVDGLTEQSIEAAVSPLEPHVLLGRDYLNLHVVILNGPELALEIGPGQ